MAWDLGNLKATDKFYFTDFRGSSGKFPFKMSKLPPPNVDSFPSVSEDIVVHRAPGSKVYRGSLDICHQETDSRGRGILLKLKTTAPIDQIRIAPNFGLLKPGNGIKRVQIVIPLDQSINGENSNVRHCFLVRMRTLIYLYHYYFQDTT